MELTSEIPVVDFGQFISSSDSGRRDVAAEVDRALSSSGLMYLHNHGIEQSKVDECFAWVSNATFIFFSTCSIAS
jgi:isopenicillin N synthase-like dioxygenase